MSANFSIKQGDTLPVLSDTLTYSNGTAVNLAGATVNLVMRAITAATPVTLTGTTSVVTPAAGTVQYTFSAADSANAGHYQAVWQVTFAGGQIQQFPTVGYIDISVEENLTSAGGQLLVSLGEVKDYLNILPADRSQDAKLLRLVNSLTPVIEFITGPILQRQYEEIYDGGQYFIQLRHRPVLSLIGVSEFRGPIEYVLPLVADPAHGQIYSVELDGSRVVRRSAGGGVIAFPNLPQSIHVAYTAGFLTTPSNVSEGALELIRIHYQGTQQGRPRTGQSEIDFDEPGRQIMGFFVPNGVRERLSPNRRHASVA